MNTHPGGRNTLRDEWTNCKSVHRSRGLSVSSSSRMISNQRDLDTYRRPWGATSTLIHLVPHGTPIAQCLSHDWCVRSLSITRRCHVDSAWVNYMHFRWIKKQLQVGPNTRMNMILRLCVLAFHLHMP